MMKKFYKENKVMVVSAVLALIGALAVLVLVKSEVDRFIFIMPIFAGWILFNILMLPDDDIQEENQMADEDKDIIKKTPKKDKKKT